MWKDENKLFGPVSNSLPYFPIIDTSTMMDTVLFEFGLEFAIKEQFTTLDQLFKTSLA